MADHARALETVRESIDHDAYKKRLMAAARDAQFELMLGEIRKRRVIAMIQDLKAI